MLSTIKTTEKGGAMNGFYRNVLASTAAAILLLTPALARGDDGDNLDSRTENFSESQWEVFEVMMDLDEQQWQTVKRLLTLDEGQLILLEEYIAADGEAYVTDDGEVQRAGAGMAEGGGGQRYTEGVINQVKSIVTSVSSKVNSTLSKLGSVQTVVGDIKAAIADRPDIKELVANLQATKVGEMVQNVGEVIQGFIAIVQDLRAGFEEFAPGGDCEAGTCGEFKDRLAGLFDDVEDLWVMLQGLQCFESPDVTIREIDTTMIKNLVVEKAPPILLFVMYKLLEQFPQWDSGIDQALAFLPTELAIFCEADNPLDHLNQQVRESADAPGCLASADPICCTLRPADLAKKLKRAKYFFKATTMIFEIAECWVADDKVVQAGATAVAGASGGTNVKHPGNGLLKTVKTVLSEFPPLIDAILKKRGECLAADKQMEYDLLACNAMVDYVLTQDEGGSFEVIVELAERNISKLEAAGKANPTAVAEVQRAIQSEDFGAMCTAYSHITD